LEKAKSWVKELQRQANSNIVIAFVGNKVDLVQGNAAASSSTSSNGDEDNDDSEADDATATPDDGTDSDANSPASKRQVSRQEAEAYAKEAGLLFGETSAKTGEGVVEIFTEIGQLCRGYT
jgi:GTPase SAR1 family protein